MVLAPHPVDTLEGIIKSYFKISDRFDLLPHLYSDWNKTFFSGVCKEIADGAIKGKKQ